MKNLKMSGNLALYFLNYVIGGKKIFHPAILKNMGCDYKLWKEAFEIVITMENRKRCHLATMGGKDQGKVSYKSGFFVAYASFYQHFPTNYDILQSF